MCIRDSPSIQFFIDGLCAFHNFAACRELADEFSLITVRGTDGDFFEAGKDIELSQRNAGHAVHSYSVTHAHGIEPAAAPRTAGGGAKLGAFAPEGFTLGSVEFRREWAAAHSRRIGLRDANHLLNFLRTDA